MKKSYLIIAIIIIIILAGLCVFLNIKMLQYKKVIDYHFPVSETMVNVMGEITNIQDKTISIKTTIKDFYNIPEDWKTEIIKIIATDQTKITKTDLETEKSTEISLSDIKIGDKINAQANENIKSKTEFTATFIQVFIIPETE